MFGWMLCALAACDAGFGYAAARAEWRLRDSLPVEWEGRDIVVTGVIRGLPVIDETGARLLFAVEVETLWRCLGEGNRYVYAAVKAFGRQTRAADTLAPATEASGERSEAEASPEDIHTPPPAAAAATTASALLDLKEKYPTLYDRISNEEMNEQCAPQFGRRWFSNLAGGGGGGEEEVASCFDPPLSTYEQPAPSAEAGGSGASSSGDAVHAAAGGGEKRGRGRGRSRSSGAARPLDPEAEVFRPGGGAWRGESV